MTEKELQKLKRADLLEILVEQGKEIENLRAEKEALQKKLEDRTISIDKAGTIAEAAFQLNGVYDAVNRAAAQYLENIMSLSERQEALCAKMEQETKEKCDAMIAEAEKGVEERWADISRRLEAFYEAHKGLRELLSVFGKSQFDKL